MKKKRNPLFPYLTPGLNDELNNWYTKLVRHPHDIQLLLAFEVEEHRDDLSLLRF